MAKCIYCGEDFNEKILSIHKSWCKEQFAPYVEKANTITLEKSTKSDLSLYILTNTEEYSEADLKSMNKTELLEIAQSFKEA